MDFTPFESDALFSDPEAAAKEIDKVGFTGALGRDAQFGSEMNFDQLMPKVEEVIDKTTKALIRDKKDLTKTYLKEITDLLPIIANARRKGSAASMLQSFITWADKKAGFKNLTIVMKPPISRPPFVYEEIDFKATYNANSHRVGIQAWKEQIEEYANTFNSNRQSLSHARAVRLLEDLHRKLVNGCK
ncbi:hypothetical protein A9Z42_0088700 [Trichoderma parareesei]|uniref:Uncharacterized protein n=1 Tax=Trichoderma parareesei TaxID=858221 RepID=A0A2H2ZMC3_TRIPA|nr:hypothetical protein A9Z42_0088700 [Trichoderma parareesei]